MEVPVQKTLLTLKSVMLTKASVLPRYANRMEFVRYNEIHVWFYREIDSFFKMILTFRFGWTLTPLLSLVPQLQPLQAPTWNTLVEPLIVLVARKCLLEQFALLTSLTLLMLPVFRLCVEHCLGIMVCIKRYLILTSINFPNCSYFSLLWCYPSMPWFELQHGPTCHWSFFCRN